MPKRIGVRFEDWPAADRLAWNRATARDDYFADDAVAAHWRDKTRYQALTAYGRWLAFVAGCEAHALQWPPLERASPSLLSAHIDAVAQRVTPASVVAEINHLRHALRAVAPTLDQAWLAAVMQRWTKKVQRRDQRHKMIDASRLHALGIGLMDGAEQGPDPRAAAREFRDGLLIALLTAVPLRRRNLAQLELGTSVLRDGLGWTIVIDRESTKSNEPLEYSVPQDLVPYLLKYLETFRPHFQGADSDRALWLSSKGGRLGAEAIYDVVCRRTLVAFGFAIHPHLFRSIAATKIARDAPGQIMMARDLLGHANVATTDRYYRRSRTIEASQRHAAVLAALRKT